MARDIDIKIDKALLNLDKTAKKGIISGLNEIGDRVQREAKRNTGYRDITGDLRRKTLKQAVNEKELSVTIIGGFGLEYGIYINDGTPFIKPRRFLERGRDKVAPRFETIFVKHLNRAIDRG